MYSFMLHVSECVCMYMYVCIFACTCVCTYIHAYVRTYIHTHIYNACTHTCIHPYRGIYYKYIYVLSVCYLMYVHNILT